jgi:3D (Asp-Asp-Asp) domain-containing protein
MKKINVIFSLIIIIGIGIILPAYNVNKTLIEDKDKNITAYTLSNNPKEILDEIGIKTSAKDKVHISDSKIKLIRVTEKTLKKIQYIPCSVEYRKKLALGLNRSKVLYEGENGIVEKLYKIVFHNDKVVSKELISERVIQKPKKKIIIKYVGVDSRNRGMASRGGLDRFTHRKCYDMVATSYTPKGRTCLRIYKNRGLKVGWGTVAVDPRVIPLGTKLFITGYGYAVAVDVGSAIKGYKIDLGFSSYHQCIKYGKRKVKVYVLD